MCEHCRLLGGLAARVADAPYSVESRRTPISRRVSAIASTALRKVSAPMAPMQPTLNVSTAVNFPRIQNESSIADSRIELAEIVRRIRGRVEGDDDRSLKGIG